MSSTRSSWPATRRVEVETANAIMRRGGIIQPPSSPMNRRPEIAAHRCVGPHARRDAGGPLAFLRDHLDDVVPDTAAVGASGADPVLASVKATPAGAEPPVSMARTARRPTTTAACVPPAGLVPVGRAAGPAR